MMYRLRLVSESDKFKFIDVFGDCESIADLANYIDVIKKNYLSADIAKAYWNLEGIYTVDGTETSKSWGIMIEGK